MRIRRLLAACVLAGAAIVAMPSVASADPGKAEAEHLRHCVEEALADTKGTTGNSELQNALEDCHKAKSIVVPATAELLWGGDRVPHRAGRAHEVRVPDAEEEA